MSTSTRSGMPPSPRANEIWIWTARAFDARRPVRDALFAIALSLGAYLLFARVLQLQLPSGVLGRWL